MDITISMQLVKKKFGQTMETDGNIWFSLNIRHHGKRFHLDGDTFQYYENF